MASPFGNNTRSEECGTSCFSGYVKNLFTSTAYQARFDKKQWIKKRRFYLFKAKISQHKWIPNERRNFRWSTNYTTIGRPRHSTKLNSTGRRAWKAFENICRNFPGKENVKLQWNCAGANFIIQYYGMYMSLKLHFLHSHLEFFPWKHGSHHVQWRWRKAPSGHFRNGKGVQWKRDAKYFGWQQLDSYQGDTNWRI